MLENILNFITSLSESLSAFLDLFIEFLVMGQDVGALMWLLVCRIPVFFSWMPGMALGLITMMFSIAVIYKIVGRS